jgi:hypothetical protein
LLATVAQGRRRKIQRPRDSCGFEFRLDHGQGQEGIEVIKTPWRQVLAGGWDAHNVTLVAYGVEVIPSIWLIDPEGRIAAKELTPEALDKELAQRIGR